MRMSMDNAGEGVGVSNAQGNHRYELSMDNAGSYCQR